ncbi:Hypothetical predicted protein [Octopus vulgaris]|uniref:Uncharacterized protein n=1 Tax=Octopus vulgaris TaxID=6645 RepID=A0AA36AQH8_OCTVU|nr:Hypothetical predicted protein [Octopus vulgaris]
MQNLVNVETAYAVIALVFLDAAVDNGITLMRSHLEWNNTRRPENKQTGSQVGNGDTDKDNRETGLGLRSTLKKYEYEWQVKSEERLSGHISEIRVVIK